MDQLKAYPTIWVCGLDCGLCPRYFTVGPSRCPGCGGPRFSEKHPSCAFITCCGKKRELEVCGQCPEFPCSKFKGEEEYRKLESSSYPPSRSMLSNLRFVKEEGIEKFVVLQTERIRLLETMIERYDEGRSKSFFCRAAALLEPTALACSLVKAKASTGAGRGGSTDNRHRARVLRTILAEAALCSGIELKAKKAERERAHLPGAKRREVS